MFWEEDNLKGQVLAHMLWYNFGSIAKHIHFKRSSAYSTLH